MRIVWAHLCDLAFMSQDGKPNLIGIFDALRGRTLPLRLDRATIAFNLELLAGDPTEVPVRLRLVDEDGAPAWEHTLTLGIHGGGGARKLQPTFFVNFSQIDLPTPGTWEFELTVADERTAVPLDAVLVSDDEAAS